jgi:hypothetical protein
MGRIIPYIMENNKCLKPPTRDIVYSTSLSRAIYICVCVSCSIYIAAILCSVHMDVCIVQGHKSQIDHAKHGHRWRIWMAYDHMMFHL